MWKLGIFYLKDATKIRYLFLLYFFCIQKRYLYFRQTRIKSQYKKQQRIYIIHLVEDWFKGRRLRMLKVLIADDEQLICRMLTKMIDWEKEGLELLDCVYNGRDVLDAIENKRPDIVITDICMPCMDGLQIVEKAKEKGIHIDFIIMSGYKNFEYAHTALNLGVKHYLLKPINKNELNEILRRIVAERKTICESEERIERLVEKANNGTKKIRKHFLNNVIRNNRYTRSLMEDGKENEELNEEPLNCEFQQDSFIALFTKIDAENPNYDMKSLLDEVNYLIEKNLQLYDWEYINSYVNSGVITMINYPKAEYIELEAVCEKLFSQCRLEMDKFSGFYVTLGVGETKERISEVQDSIRESVEAIQCRLKKGVNRLIMPEELKYREIKIADIFTENDRNNLAKTIESLDYNAYNQYFMEMYTRIKEYPKYSPTVIFELIDQLKEQIIEIWNENDIDETICNEFEKEIQYVMDFNIKEDMMIYSVSEDIRIYFTRVYQENQNKSKMPIRIAKKYIQENFDSPITLEEVAEAISLSPAYLSTLFKKEIGIKFSDYLISCRMEKAKQLLKESGESMQIIAEQVGYSDAKYFSKTFFKTVGLKPSEYRKLYR